MADSEEMNPDWQNTLIRFYLFVCRHWTGRLQAVAQQQSNNSEPDFTDEEVLTIYLFGLIRDRETIKAIHEYDDDHFYEWFPDLPCYGRYVQGLNRLSGVFVPLLSKALEEIDRKNVVESSMSLVRIADSMPIILAKEKCSSQASVAGELADKGYCFSKGTFFYGVKLHAVGHRKRCTMPVLECVRLTPGSENDLTALRRVAWTLEGGQFYGDRAYCDAPMKARLAKEQDLDVLTPVKKKKGQKRPCSCLPSTLDSHL